MACDSFTTWLEIDLDAVRGNVAAAQRLIGGGCGILAVVKADAYGHGARPVAQAALAAGAAGLCVANLTEAEQLRRAGIAAPILLLTAGPPRQAGQVVRRGLIQAVYERPTAEALSRAAVRLGREAEVHIKLDTGMGRLGIPPEQAGCFAGELATLPALRVTGAFSHLATAEEADPSYARQQFERFLASLEAMRAVFPHLRAHLANSAATLRFPEMRLDFVRLGLLVYGVYPTNREEPGVSLQPVLAWKTSVAFARRALAGTSVSYGRTWRAAASTTLVTLPVGYADGYPRTLSNRGQVLFRGRLRRVVGTVCMNHLVADVGEEPKVRPGEEVVLLGEQGAARITAGQLAEWAGTVPHEILARIAGRLPRSYRSTSPG